MIYHLIAQKKKQYDQVFLVTTVTFYILRLNLVQSISPHSSNFIYFFFSISSLFIKIQNSTPCPNVSSFPHHLPLPRHLFRTIVSSHRR